MPSFRNSLLLCTTSMLLAHGAQAQSPSCELLKQTLASRIPPEIKGYAMDDVPARTPVPPGGKVIGTCEGGARKVIYRRFGGPPLASDGGATASTPAPAAQAAAPAPTPAPTPAPAPRPASAPSPVMVQKEPPKPKPEPVAPPKPPTPPAAPAPVASSPAPVVVAAAKPTVVDKPAEPLMARAATPAPASLPAEPPAPRATPASDNDEPGFFSTYGHWLWLLLALPFVAWLWSWVSHRMAYDSAGLPRGPRL